MLNRKILAMAGVGAMMIGLVACGSKAESNIAESATPAPTAEATPTPEPTEEPVESHDFDLSVNKYKSESDIKIKQYSGDSVSDTADCDSGTDIENLDTLHDWLYSHGIYRESVQNDKDAGCKNPYLDGYLEYLDGLVEKAAGTVASSSAPEKVDPSTISGEPVEIAGFEGYTYDGEGGAYSPEGWHYDKEHWERYVEGQKELAELDKANRANQNALDETNESRVTHEEAVDFVKNDLHINVNE